MKKNVTLTILIATLILGLSVVAQAAEKKLLLKAPLVFATALPVLGDTVPEFAADVKAMSNGNINVKLYEPGKLLPPFEILGAVSAGKVNAGCSTAAYWQGKMPEAALFSAFPFGPEIDEYMAWFFEGNGMKLYQEMYDNAGYNVKVILIGFISAETSGWFAKPIDTVDDLKGLKMRFFGLGGKVMQKLGVAVSMLPAGEIFQALEKGVIDATEFSLANIDQKLGFYKVAKYNYWPGWHQPGGTQELLINKDTWNSMTTAQQAIILSAAKQNIVRSISRSEAQQGAAIRENVEKRGVINKYWSDEMLAVFETTWKEVSDEHVAKYPEFKKIWDDLTVFRAEYDYWKKLGFLPRTK
jgi:TRAP-type mannitol/chloroaromatic compound transport system substrate-binding protein